MDKISKTGTKANNNTTSVNLSIKEGNKIINLDVIKKGRYDKNEIIPSSELYIEKK